jgi:hypothetical protein
MLAYGRRIVILPFRQDAVTGHTVEEPGNEAELSLDGLALGQKIDLF